MLVDTNVLISFLTDREPEQQALANELFEAAALGRLSVVLHQAVLSESVYALRSLYRLEDALIRSHLQKLLALPGVSPHDELAWPLLLDLWPDSLGDFADAALAAVALQQRSFRIATFDRKFLRGLRKLDLPVLW